MGQNDEASCQNNTKTSRKEEPSYARIDSQSVKTTCYGENHGYDGENYTLKSPMNTSSDSGTTGWNTYYQTGGVCSLGTDDGKLALKVSATGDVTWAVQVYYDIIPLFKI